MSEKIYGVIGAGSFGITIANLLAENANVLLYARRSELAESINKDRTYKGAAISPRVVATDDIQAVAEKCTLIFPIVPSGEFRSMMTELGPYLKPYHILIHGTKGFDLTRAIEGYPITRKQISTMSEVIEQESVVVRIGCLSGPNLSAEIQMGQPAATVIASQYTEVIKAGQEALKSNRFQVYGSHDLLGAELAGALKNIIALGAGALAGKGLGKNVWALLVTRGLSEMIHLGKAMGTSAQAFLGIAGIGDLMATAASTNSRNFTLGYRFAKGETLAQIQTDSEEVAEGLRTLNAAKAVADYYKVHAPITQVIHRIFYKGMDIDEALQYLINFPYSVDVDFL